ncbi:uncharacterized protein BX664DRAFT_382031 [Halteromyces radiatus]|uniref:uncharacterized protein n=1 Tax=Halteromyces radiatus TaxID=101107 RepID=UPI00221F38AD|nr:uncharacterized protein BX664DRAFT_382031 [Halteromyces radiatus]KAI8099494.1 hypothetical protein BX664DRAFT_382031 [Halteromyces radiatus]
MCPNVGKVSTPIPSNSFEVTRLPSQNVQDMNIQILPDDDLFTLLRKTWQWFKDNPKVQVFLNKINPIFDGRPNIFFSKGLKRGDDNGGISSEANRQEGNRSDGIFKQLGSASRSCYDVARHRICLTCSFIRMLTNGSCFPGVFLSELHFGRFLSSYNIVESSYNRIQDLVTRKDSRHSLLYYLDVEQHERMLFQQFGVNIKIEMAMTKTHVLPTPKITYHISSQKDASAPISGVWNLRVKKVGKTANLRSRSIVNFANNVHNNMVQGFIRELKRLLILARTHAFQFDAMKLPSLLPSLVHVQLATLTA